MKLIMDGIQRLEQEVLEMNNFNVYAIFNHIKNLPELQDKFDNKEKTIKGMYEYICSKAKTLQQNNVAMVNDAVVYSWTTNYFKLSNKELGIKDKNVPPPSVDKIKDMEQTIKLEETEKKNDNENCSQISMFSEVSN